MIKKQHTTCSDAEFYCVNHPDRIAMVERDGPRCWECYYEVVPNANEAVKRDKLKRSNHENH